MDRDEIELMSKYAPWAMIVEEHRINEFEKRQNLTFGIFHCIQSEYLGYRGGSCSSCSSSGGGCSGCSGSSCGPSSLIIPTY